MAGPEFKKGYNKGFEDGANSVEEGLPGWFGTFADMMTLLFAFFVLLAAISTMDPVKLQEMLLEEFLHYQLVSFFFFLLSVYSIISFFYLYHRHNI